MNEQELKEQIKQELKQEMKKSRRKKRIIFLIIFIVIISVVAFVIILNNRKNVIDTEDTGMTETEDIEMTKEEFAQYVTAIPVTTENWSEYIELEDETYENTNAFGEITRTTTTTTIKPKDKVFYYDVVLEIEKNEDRVNYGSTTSIISELTSNGQSLDFSNKSTESNVFDYTFTLDDLECTRAEGTIYIIDLPEEKLKDTPDTNQKYFCVEGKYYYYDSSPESYSFINSLCSEVTNAET